MKTNDRSAPFSPSQPFQPFQPSESQASEPRPRAGARAGHRRARPSSAYPFFIGDRVSVRCPRSRRPGDNEDTWLGGMIIARDAGTAIAGKGTRYVVQLDDLRRVIAFDDDVRRWTLAFEIVEMLEKMAS